MAEYRAADLPEGSVVATGATAWVRTVACFDAPWRCTNGSIWRDFQVDQELARGAVVLRVGTGQEG